MPNARKAAQFATTTIDAPALIRILEYTREDLSKVSGDEGDVLLHFLADELLDQPRTVTMEQYQTIIERTRHRFATSQGVLSQLFYPQEELEAGLRSTGSIEYGDLTPYTKLQNYGAALMVDGIPSFSAFKKMIFDRPTLSDQVLPAAIEQTGWDESKLLHKVYDIARAKAKDLKKTYKGLPASVDRAIEAYHEGESGTAWYQEAHQDLERIFGDDADLMADFIAATSPGNNPSTNLQKALTAYEQYKSGQPFHDVGTHYGDKVVVPNLERAVDRKPLHGLKVWNFSRALRGDRSAVVVDMWMARVFLGQSEVKSDGEYLLVEQLVREVAHRLRKAALDVAQADIEQAATEGLFRDYPSVQARIWYGINQKPQSYPEVMEQRLRERHKTSPEFWEPYLEKHQQPRASAQLYVIQGTKDSGVPYPITGPLPQSEATNLLAKQRELWTDQGYENLQIIPYQAPEGEPERREAMHRRQAEIFHDFSPEDIEALMTYHGGQGSALYSVGSRLGAQWEGAEIEPISSEDVEEAVLELERHKQWLEEHPQHIGPDDSGTPEEVDSLIEKLQGLLGQTEPRFPDREASRRKADHPEEIQAEIEKETEEEQRENQHNYPGLVLVYQGMRLPIDAGHGDHIDVFEDRGTLYVLAVNRRLPYVGLAVYEPEVIREKGIKPEESGSIFLQEEQSNEVLGDDWRHTMEPEDILRKLKPYVEG